MRLSHFNRLSLRRGWADTQRMAGTEQKGALIFIVFVLIVASLLKVILFGDTAQLVEALKDSLATALAAIVIFAGAFIYNWSRAPQQMWLDGARLEGLAEHQTKELLLQLSRIHPPRFVRVALADISRERLCNELVWAFSEGGWTAPKDGFYTDRKQTVGLWICGKDAEQTEMVIAELFDSIGLTYESDPDWTAGGCVTLFVGRVPLV